MSRTRGASIPKTGTTCDTLTKTGHYILCAHANQQDWCTQYDSPLDCLPRHLQKCSECLENTKTDTERTTA
jgi:ribosome-associated translation inhibitor RaiA